MMPLNKPDLMWGIAHTFSTETQTLFANDLFVFERDALKYIRTAKKVGVSGLSAVAVEVAVSLCDHAKATAFKAEQDGWLAERRKKQ